MRNAQVLSSCSRCDQHVRLASGSYLKLSSHLQSRLMQSSHGGEGGDTRMLAKWVAESIHQVAYNTSKAKWVAESMKDEEPLRLNTFFLAHKHHRRNTLIV
ncbi:hypothetical protein YC2023_089475 [Brassica napus]